MSAIEIKVPDIGDFKEVEVIELLVKPGDTIKAEQSLITVESDKASMEIPSSHGGVVREMKIKIGDKVSEGTVVVVLETAEALAPVGGGADRAATVIGASMTPSLSAMNAASRTYASACAGESRTWP